jgi:hypothetical protein
MVKRLATWTEQLLRDTARAAGADLQQDVEQGLVFARTVPSRGARGSGHEGRGPRQKFRSGGGEQEAPPLERLEQRVLAARTFVTDPASIVAAAAEAAGPAATGSSYAFNRPPDFFHSCCQPQAGSAWVLRGDVHASNRTDPGGSVRCSWWTLPVARFELRN